MVKRLTAITLVMLLAFFAPTVEGQRVPFQGGWVHRIGRQALIRYSREQCTNPAVLKHLAEVDNPKAFREGVFIEGGEVVRFCWFAADWTVLHVKENGDVLFTSDKSVQEIEV